MINHKHGVKELLTNKIMKKEEICVLIDTPEKDEKAYKILTKAGEKMYERTLERLKNSIICDGNKYIIFDGEEWIGNDVNNKNITSLKQLKNLLKPKEFAIPINDESEYLKVKEVAEFLGYKEGNTYIFGEKYVIFINGKFSSHMSIGTGWKLKSYTKFINKMPINNNTVSIEIPLKYIPAIESILNELKQAEIKHPDFVESKYQLVSLLTEESGEVAKDVNDGKFYKKELAQVGVLVLRGLSYDFKG
jgi:hypothetical protein